MMISPESYYEYELKGKSEDEIITEIRSLKRKISKLKKTLESPSFCPKVDPSEDVQLYWTKKYLEKAIQALNDIGCVYRPTKAELKAQDFDNNIENIKLIEFVIGSFDSYRPKRVYHFINDRVRCEEDYDGFSFEVEKQDFLAKLRDIHIGEWNKEYSTERYNIIILDGIQWELSICYDNSHKPITIYGDNAYPYNFKDLLWLLGINPSIIEDNVEGDDEMSFT